MNVYLDNAATTPMAAEVIEEITAVMKNHYGNPSSTHAFGRGTKAVIELARRKIAGLIHAESKEIIFTSGGTEADNMAISMSINDLDVTHIITTSTEHHAVLYSVQKRKDIEVSFVNQNENGVVDMLHLEELLQKPGKALVTLMHANNEIGTLLNIEKTAELCEKHNAFFHSDTVQTMGHYAINVKTFGADFLSCSAHKFHGPKGMGFLFINKNLKVSPLIIGGSQERGMRAGTENITGIVGLAKAFDLANVGIEEHQKQVQGLKSYMITELKKRIPNVSFHGETTPEKSLYTVLNVCFPPFENKAMLLFLLDLDGIACSGGSACSSGANAGSHVLRGINADTERPNARFSFSRYTTKEELDYTLGIIEKIVNPSNNK